MNNNLVGAAFAAAVVVAIFVFHRHREHEIAPTPVPVSVPATLPVPVPLPTRRPIPAPAKAPVRKFVTVGKHPTEEQCREVEAAAQYLTLAQIRRAAKAQGATDAQIEAGLACLK